MPGRIQEEMESSPPPAAGGVSQGPPLDTTLESTLTILRLQSFSSIAELSRPPPSSHRQKQTYIARNSPTYFSSPDLELADPLLYDRLIRQHQTPTEREAEGRRKGWSGILHADLERSEAKVDALRENPSSTLETRAENDWGEAVTSKQEAEQVWRETMTLRFMEGRDHDVDYDTIDNNEEYDDHKQIERDAQDAYFDAESPAVEGATSGDTGIQDF